MNYANFFFCGIVLTIISDSIAAEKYWDDDYEKIWHDTYYPEDPTPVKKSSSDNYFLLLDKILGLELEIENYYFNMYAIKAGLLHSILPTKNELSPSQKQKLLQEICPTQSKIIRPQYNQLKNTVRHHQLGKGKKARIQGKR